MAGRTMAEIAQRYDEGRELTLRAIREGRTSASMSGIENYPKPWAELDMSDHYDSGIISTALTWDGDQHDHDPLRKRTPQEMALHKKWSDLFREPCGDERERKIEAVKAELRSLIPPNPC